MLLEKVPQLNKSPELSGSSKRPEKHGVKSLGTARKETSVLRGGIKKKRGDWFQVLSLTPVSLVPYKTSHDRRLKDYIYRSYGTTNYYKYLYFGRKVLVPHGLCHPIVQTQNRTSDCNRYLPSHTIPNLPLGPLFDTQDPTTTSSCSSFVPLETSRFVPLPYVGSTLYYL